MKLEDSMVIPYLFRLDLYFFPSYNVTLNVTLVRRKNHLIPIEVKANDGSTVSLNNLINKEEYADISYGIKLAHKNIGNNGKFYTIPYFLTFLLERFLQELE